MTILKYKILQVTGKNLLFRKCGKCTSILVFAVDDGQGKSLFYCNKCKELAESYKITYQLEFIALDICKNLVETAIAYNEVTEKFIGCTANAFAEFLEQDPLLIRKLEQELVGMYCTVEVLNKKTKNAPMNEKKKTDKKCKSLVLQYPGNVKLIDILQKQIVHDDIQYDASLITI